MKKTFTILAMTGLGLSTLTGFSQGGPNRPVEPPHHNRVPFEIPEELQDLKVAAEAAHDALKASRDELIEALGSEATREEIQAAIEEWKMTNEDSIAAARALADELRESIRELRPDRPGRPDMVEPSEAVREALEESKAIREVLKVTREAVLADLAEDATIEEKRAVMDAWREANVDSLSRLDELNEIIREANMGNRPDRGERPNRGGVVRDRVKAFRETAKAERDALREALDAATTDEERAALIKAFRDKQKALMDERKELHRLERTRE